MKKIFLLALIPFIYTSCTSGAIYVKEVQTQTTGIDFSNGKWLLGNIEVDSDIKDEFTQTVFKDFSKHLDDRIKNTSDVKSLLIATKVPFNPTKSAISDLKKGTNYDYYINIKCTNQRSYSDEDITDKAHYIRDITFGIVQLEVYDLNQGIIIYSQRIRGWYDEQKTFAPKPGKILIRGCYQKIMKDINAKS